MENQKKSNGGLIAILIILLVVIIGLCSFIFYDKILNNKKVNETNTSSNKEEIEEEKEIISINLKNELKNQINYLYTVNGLSGVIDTLVKEVSLEKMTEDEKLLIVLNSLVFSRTTQPITLDNYFDEILKLHNLQIPKQTVELTALPVSVVLEDDVKDRFQELFGTMLEKITTSRVGKCPRWAYSESTKTYISYGGCGGVRLKQLFTFNNKYSTKGDESYVYISGGFVDVENRSIYTEYSENLDSKTSYKKLDDNASYADYQKILEENYKDFSEYKVTFKKNSNGDYYFYSVKKQ